MSSVVITSNAQFVPLLRSSLYQVITSSPDVFVNEICVSLTVHSLWAYSNSRTFVEPVLLCTDPPHQYMSDFARCSSHLGRSMTTKYSLVSAVSLSSRSVATSYSIQALFH